MSLLNQLLVWALPWVPKPFVRAISKRYVAGESIESLCQTVRQLNQEGYLCTVDVLGEFIHQAEEAREAASLYKVVLQELHQRGLQANISVKLSQMGLLLDPTLCLEIMEDLVQTAARFGNFVRIDMEDSSCTEATLNLYLALRKQHQNVGIVVQAYLRRTLSDTQRVIDAGAGHFRLCKGIYREPRRLAYPSRELINRNYVRILESMLQQNAYVGIATHDERLVWEAERLISQYQRSRDSYEFQMLLGVDPELRELIRDAGHRLRVYVPFGKHWYAYSVRRLKENPTIAGYVFRQVMEEWGFFQKKA